MKTIWKFPFKISDVVRFMAPEHSEVLSIQMQNGVSCIWMLVCPGNRLIEKKFRIVGTGHPIDGFLGKFVGTIQEANGLLVWHIFEQ